MSMQNKRGIKYFFQFFFYLGGIACLTSYLNVYLEKVLGFSGTELGIYTGLTSFLPAFFVPIISYYGDKIKKHKMIFVGVIGLQIICAILLSMQKSVVMVVLIGMVMEIAHYTAQPLADTLTTQFAAKEHVNYGILRSGGSFGFTLGGVMAGILVSKLGNWSIIFPLYIGCLVMAFVCGMTFSGEEEKTEAKPLHFQDVALLLKNPSYLLAILLMLTATMSTDGLLSYIGNHLTTTLGAEATSISINTAVCVVPEFVLLPLCGALLPKIGYRKCYLISAICLVIRFAIYSIAPTAGIFIVGSVLQAFTVCCSTVVNMAFLKRIVPSALLATAVTVGYSFANLGRAVFSFFFGKLYQNVGSFAIFRLMLILQVVMLLVVATTKHLEVSVEAEK